MAKYPSQKLSSKRPPAEVKFISKHFDKFGPVLWEWNLAHANLWLVFWALLGDDGSIEKRHKAFSIWQFAQTDDGQRKLLRSLAESCTSTKPATRKRLYWVLDRLLEIAPFRNIAAHLALEFGLKAPKRSIIHVAVKDVYATRLRLVHSVDKLLWRKISRDLYMLQQYILDIWVKVLFPAEPLPWPDKPRLLSIPSTRKLKARLQSLQQSPKQLRPPRGNNA